MKRKLSTRPRFAGFSLPFAAGALALSGCSAADSFYGADTEPAPSGGEEVGVVSESLDWKATLCELANAVPSFEVGSVSIDAPTCSFHTTDDLLYFGGGGPGNYSKTIADATYCAVADSAGTSSAVFGTVVGNFGTESKLRTFARNNQTRHIETEHVGSVVVFGVKVPFQYNTTAWDFPTESQPAKTAPAIRETPKFVYVSTGHSTIAVLRPESEWTHTPYTQNLPAQTGYYARTRSQNLTGWSIGGNGTVVIGPVPIHIEVGLKSSEPMAGYDNGQFSPAPASWSNYRTTVDPFNLCVATCLANQGIFCDSGCAAGMPSPPTANQISGHELQCAGGCTPAYFRNLTDGFLPYSGTGSGARGNILYWDAIDNFWQFGYPGTPPLAGLGEKKYDLHTAPLGKSTDFFLNIGAEYDLGVASIGVTSRLDFETRAGASLRSTAAANIDGTGERASVKMQLDSETAINLNASLRLEIDISPFSPLVFEADYDFIDRDPGKNGHREGAPFTGANYQWTVNRAGTNNAGTSTCTAFQTPQTTTAQPPTKNGWDMVEEIATASVDQMHPCNVRICVPSSPSSTTGKLTTYKWNAAGRKLVPTNTNTSCNVCESTASLCNNVVSSTQPEGTVVTAFTPLSKPTSCGGTGNICSGTQSCDTPSDCPGPQWNCMATGCCTLVR